MVVKNVVKCLVSWTRTTFLFSCARIQRSFEMRIRWSERKKSRTNEEQRRLSMADCWDLPANKCVSRASTAPERRTQKQACLANKCIIRCVQWFELCAMHIHHIKRNAGILSAWLCALPFISSSRDNFFLITYTNCDHCKSINILGNWMVFLYHWNTI